MLTHKSYDDQELLSMLKANNDMGIKYIYDKYWKRLYLFAFSIVRDVGPCEDIVQDILLQLWVKRHDVAIDVLKSYLFTAVRYKVLSYINSANQRKIFLEPGELEYLAGIEELEDRLNERDINNILESGISSLPARCKEVFVLSRKKHLTNKEIADQMGISIKTVEAQMTIALKQLKICMGEFLVYISVVISLLK
jgi:RNA polymerase sigma-70 factor (ECF subfamily)